MVDKAVAPHVEVSSSCPPGVELLSEGVPINLVGHTAATYIARCNAALAELGEKDSLLAVKLMTAKVVVATHSHVTHEEQGVEAAMAERGQLMAQRLRDELAHAYGLVAWGFTHPGPEHSHARIAAGNEILEIASRHKDSSLVPLGFLLLLVGLLEQGDIRALDTELLRQRAQVDEGYGSVVRWFQCLRSILDGETERAEREAKELFALSEQRGTAAQAILTTHLGMIRRMQGRIDEVEEALLLTRRQYPEQVLWTASLAWLWLLQGRATAAGALLRSIPDVEAIPRDRYWLSTLTVLADIAITRGTHEDAARLRALLLPFADQLVPVGVGVAFWGTCARTLGMLEERLGLLDDARTHLEMAVELSARVGAVAWHAEAQIDLAEFALRHDVLDIPAYDLLAEARVTSEVRGFVALAYRAMYRPRIRVLGGFEVTSLCGKRADWSSRKARELLKMLVAARGRATSREVFMDVLWPGESPALLGNRFSVAINVIRRSLDPQRLRPTQHHVVTEGDSVRLQIDHLDIDLERFLGIAQHPDPKSREAALQLYLGDAFAEDPYADWAVGVREHARRVRRSLT